MITPDTPTRLVMEKALKRAKPGGYITDNGKSCKACLIGETALAVGLRRSIGARNPAFLVSLLHNSSADFDWAVNQSFFRLEPVMVDTIIDEVCSQLPTVEDLRARLRDCYRPSKRSVMSYYEVNRRKERS